MTILHCTGRDVVLSEELTEKAQKIYDVIAAADGTIDRSGIAEALDQPILYPYDREILKQLEGIGMIKVHTFKAGGNTFYQYELSAKPDQEDER